MGTKDKAEWQDEINELKHMIEILVTRDGWAETMTGDELDYAIAKTFNHILTIGYQEAATAAELRQDDYPCHPIVRQALALLASYYRTL